MGFFKKNKSNEPTRPETVPAEAVWNESENEWELGQKNENGEPTGEWKWWLAPNGHLVCHTIYDENNSGNFTYTRYHADGTFSRKGKYVDNIPVGDHISQKSVNPTTEIYNPRDGFKAVSTFRDKYIVEEHYFDEEGNEIGEPFIA